MHVGGKSGVAGTKGGVSGAGVGHPDIDQDLSDRICNLLPSYQGFTDFCEKLKTKNRTYTRIARSLMHVLLQIRKEASRMARAEQYVFNRLAS